MAFSWDGLIQQLVECEKLTLTAKRAGDKGLEQAQAKINMMTTRLAETTIAHEEEMQEMETLSNRQLREIEAKSGKEKEVFQKAKEKAAAATFCHLH